MFVNNQHQEAVKAYDIKDFTLALKYIQEAIANETDVNAALLAEEAFIRIALKQFKEAIELFQKCIKLQPENAYRYTCLAYAFQVANKPSEAILNYLKAIELDNLEAFARYNCSLIKNDEAESQRFIANALFEEIDYVKGKMLAKNQPINPVLIVREQQKAMLKFGEIFAKSAGVSTLMDALKKNELK